MSSGTIFAFSEGPLQPRKCPSRWLRPRSAKGHSLHFGSVSMSGLPPTTTEWRTFEKVVTAKLPGRGGQFEYRIRSAFEEHERMARESELRALREEK